MTGKEFLTTNLTNDTNGFARLVRFVVPPSGDGSRPLSLRQSLRSAA
jgi:hypothetical protein